MTPTTSTLDTTTTVARTVESLPVGDDLWAVRWTDTTTRVVRREDKVVSKTGQDKAHERVLDGAQRALLLKGDTPDFKTHHILLSPTGVGIARTHGYQSLSHLLHKGTVDPDDLPWFDLGSHHTQLAHQDVHRIAQRPFTHVAAHGLGDACVVRFDSISHSLVLTDGKLLPTLCVGEYIGGNFDEAHYDLHKAAEHLLQRPNVIVLTERRFGRDISPIAQDARDAVTMIPGYNAEPGRRYCITFRWAPTQEEWDAVQGAMDNPGFCSSGIWKAVFDLDILGLRACGAARFSDFYERAESDGDDD